MAPRGDRLDALREALALRPLRGGPFSSQVDLFGELLRWLVTDPSRVDALLAAPEGKLRAHIGRVVARLARDVGIERGDPIARFQKSFAAALLAESRAARPRLARKGADVLRLPAAGGASDAWPDDLDDAGRGTFSREKLVAAALAALAARPSGAASLRALRGEVGRRYDLRPRFERGETPDRADGEGRSETSDASRHAQGDGARFDPTPRARELLARIAPADAPFWIACSEAFHDANALGIDPDLARIAEIVGCSERTVQRWIARTQAELGALTASTSLLSMQLYLHAVADLLRARV